MSFESVIPLQDISDLGNVARDLAVLFNSEMNEDIKIHFPATVRRHTGDIEIVQKNLKEAAEACRPGSREQFIIFSGAHAVGMSVVTLLPEVPVHVATTWPNLSGFVCHPYRGLGLGKQSLERRIHAVNENFGGHAWTYVRKDNVPAQAVVLGAGFKRTDFVIEGQETQDLYLYDQANC